MSVVTPVRELAEAICAGLYETDFKFEGETPDGATTRFSRGRHPKRIAVAVERVEAGAILPASVEVRVSWLNLNGDKPMRGAQKFVLNPTLARQAKVEATTQVMERILNIYADVLAGEGVAGKEAFAGLSDG